MGGEEHAELKKKKKSLQSAETSPEIERAPSTLQSLFSFRLKQSESVSGWQLVEEHIYHSRVFVLCVCVVFHLRDNSLCF